MRLRGGRVGHRGRESPCLRLARLQITTPADAAVRPVDPLQERRNHPPQLSKHQVGQLASLGQRMGAHPEQQHLVGLAGAVDPHVGPGRGRQEAAQRVQRLRANHRAIDCVRIRGRLRMSCSEILLQGLDPAGVGFECSVERRLERPAVRLVLQLGRYDVLPAAARPVGVRHVTGRLLQIGHQPPALEHLRQDVRHAFAGDVRAPELRHRVVAVLIEDPAVQALGALAARCGARAGCVASPFDPVGELFEEETADRLGRPRVPCKERALDRFRKVGQDEDRLVQVAEVGGQNGGLPGGEALRDRERRIHAI